MDQILYQSEKKKFQIFLYCHSDLKTMPAAGMTETTTVATRATLSQPAVNNVPDPITVHYPTDILFWAYGTK